GAADALHLRKEALNGIRAVLKLAIMGRRLIDVRIEETAAQRYVVELRREVGFDKRDDFVEIKQPQIRVGLGPVCAPRRAYDLGRLRRTLRHFEHIFMGLADRLMLRG